jgi:hypothetical protein
MILFESQNSLWNEPMKFQVHNDLPTTEDRLNWKQEVARICERVQGCGTPHVLGIHGDWGSGKTSFMRQVQRALGGELPGNSTVDRNSSSLEESRRIALQKRVVTVWFDAWRYQNEPVPVVALLQEMQRQLTSISSVANKIKKLASVTAYGVLDGLSDIGKILSIEGLPSVEKIEKRGEQWEKDHFSNSLLFNSLNEQLSTTIAQLLPSKSARVVIFIDDLDRCSPRSAVRLLEGLKIYLGISQCIFVIGMNERILVDAIREEISAPSSTSADELKLRASHYLEKICSDIYRLPLPSSPLALFSQWLQSEDEKQSLLLAVGNIRCLPPNPRRIKALANQWPRFASKISFPSDNLESAKIWAVRVLIASYIHQSHRDIWERWHYMPDFWNEILAWCNGDREIGSNEQIKTGWACNLSAGEKIASFDETTSQAIFKSAFPNPCDLDNFWVSELVRTYRDQLTAVDFKPLLSV